MFKKRSFQHFCSGFFSVFSFGNIPMPKLKPIELIEHFCLVESDINNSYEELKKRYEGK